MHPYIKFKTKAQTEYIGLSEATTKTNNTGNFAFQGVYPTLEYYEVFKSRSVWWSGQYKREMKRQL